MSKLTSAIIDFIERAIAFAVAGSMVVLLAGEVKLALMKKLAHGTTRLSAITKVMTR